MSRKQPLFTTIFLSCLLLVGCQNSTETEEIFVGYVGPLTGDAASYGTDTFNATQLKIDEVNAAGGIDGKIIKLIAEDGRCTPSDAAAAAQKLITIDKVVAIIGGQCSSETLAIAPIAEANQIPVLTPISSHPDISQAGSFIFRLIPSDAIVGKGFATYFTENNYKKVALITENTDFAMGVRGSIQQNLPADTELVFDEVILASSKDNRTLITRLQDLDFHVFVPNPQSDVVGASLMEQLREQGITQPAVSQSVLDSMNLLALAPEAVEGLTVITQPNFGKGTSFQTAFESQYGTAKQNIAFAAIAYDAAGILIDAMKTVGTDGSAIRDSIANHAGYDGVVGNIRFDANGDSIGLPFILKQFQGGELVEGKLLKL